MHATVRALPGPALDHALDASLGYVATGSSTAVDHPAARPGAALDGDYGTAWISAGNDPAPTLTVTFPRAVTLGQLGLSTDDASRGSLRSIVVTAGGQQRLVGLGGRRLPSFTPITATTFRFTFVRSADRTSPIRIEELVLPGLASPPSGARVRLPCGEGPSIEVGATRIDVAVDASAAALVSGAPISATPCGSGRAALARGPQLLVAHAAPVVSLQTVALGGPVARAGGVRKAQVRRNDAEHRVVAVGAGPVSLVILDEGSNPGWRATAGGHLLREVTVDRWRQAFVLPAGGPTVVDIGFAPGRWHRIGLVIGLLAMVVLVGLRLALLGQRHRDEILPSGPGRPRPATARVLVLAVGGVLGGVIGVAIALGAVVVIRWRRVALAIAAMLYGVAAVAALRSSELSGGRTASSGRDRRPARRARRRARRRFRPSAVAPPTRGGSTARAEAVRTGAMTGRQSRGCRRPWPARQSARARRTGARRGCSARRREPAGARGKRHS